MKSVKLIASIFAICAAYILLKLIFGEQINQGGNKYVHGFFKEYGDEVTLVVLLFLLFLTLADAYDWNFNPPTHKHLEKIVLVEGMGGMRNHKHHHEHHHKHHDDDNKDDDNNDDDDNDDDNKDALEHGFCKYHKGKAHDLEKACNKLSHNNCMKTSCCVKIKKTNGKEKCVAGNKHGPTYRSKNGKLIDIDGYYYKNKYYGEDKE